VTKQTFADWFTAQHGERSSKTSAHVRDDELTIMIERGQAARAELARRELWDEKRQSALYAWQARDGEVKQ
jgi:hypothetical protein